MLPIPAPGAPRSIPTLPTRSSGGRTSFTAACVAAVAVALGACSDSPVGPVVPVDVSVEAAASPLVRILDVRLSGRAGAEAEYWSEGGPRFRVVQSGSTRSHRLVLARLRPGTSYEYEVRTLGAASAEGGARGSFTTAALPPEVAAFDFIAEGTPTYPLTLFEVNRSEGDFQGMIIVDEEGVVVWYFNTGPVAGATRLDNGDFVFLDGANGLRRVAPTGAIVRDLPQEAPGGRRAHHDVITTPGNTLLFLAHETRDFEGRAIVGEAIWEWDASTSSPVQRWSSFDHLTPDVDWGPQSHDGDWLHANAISLGPAGNVLMSLRSLNQVISISSDWQTLEWRLGGVGADVEVTGDDAFHGQHSAAELPAVNGRRRVLLFDNGTIARGYSRALELELDLDAGTATTAWQFRPDPDNFSIITSLARRLPNGNTFVAFGAGPGLVGSFGPVEAFEVDPSGAVQFRVEIGGPLVNDFFVLYRATPVESLAGEHRVD